MRPHLFFSIAALIFSIVTAGGQQTPEPDELLVGPISDEDLIHCEPIYSPRGIGLAGRDTRAKLAIINIWRGENPKDHLVALYPKCSLVGQAYVLAALWHFDQNAFKRLGAEFVTHGPIQVASGCIVSNESLTELVKDMQKTNCALAFSDPPLTSQEISQRADADIMVHYEAFRITDEWKKAEAGYLLGTPHEGMVGWSVEMTAKISKNSKMPFMIDWGWEEKDNAWSPTVNIEDITEVIQEIEETPFVQAINNRIFLDIYLETYSGNFHEPGTLDEALVKAAGYAGTNRLVKVLARSPTGPLILWHPEHSQFWLITWNLKISPEWCDSYKKQTGLELTDMEAASGWAATCDSSGALKMVRCREARTLEER